MRKYLIINADDFGMCHSANMAVLDLFQSGCIHSTTLMACCPWAKEAAALCHQHPEIHVGLHVAHTADAAKHTVNFVLRTIDQNIVAVIRSHIV